MSEPVAVELFVEDHAHEKLLLPLVKRIAQKENVDVSCQMRTARGGHAQAIKEFRLYQALWHSGFLSVTPDLIVVAIDSNCAAFAQTRVEIKDATKVEFQHKLVTACPDPHIERWYMADPNSFHEIVGSRPDLGPDKCERDYYKRLLREAIQKGGNPQTLGGIEFAPELVAKMDLYQSGKADRSLKSFLDDLRRRLRSLRKSGGDHHVP